MARKDLSPTVVMILGRYRRAVAYATGAQQWDRIYAGFLVGCSKQQGTDEAACRCANRAKQSPDRTPDPVWLAARLTSQRNFLDTSPLRDCLRSTNQAPHTGHFPIDIFHLDQVVELCNKKKAFTRQRQRQTERLAAAITNSKSHNGSNRLPRFLYRLRQPSAFHQGHRSKCAEMRVLRS